MANFLTKNFVWILAAGVGVWFYQKADNAAKTATKPIADFLAELQFLVNGSNYVKFPNAGFVLTRDALQDDFIAYDDRIKAWLGTHDRHKDFLAEILDHDRRVKPVYRKLIGNIIDASTIRTASGVEL
ncbi:structural protein [Pseudoalteromonas phage Cr39582]|uniref:Structural protein n=1 Tax=Pseudoalteromonas phage Cr39582 TaxID=2099852 RepID=A0A2P1CL04_9VIRU|nr:virion structural protein [Pseudoalteromonas phage Cr39582]AVJ51882.1 structural protein [Pseudoalteromonas phage Cr39582]